MSTLESIVNFRSARSVEGAQVLGGKRFDWAVTVLSALFMIGMYLDTWAHNNIVDELEDFFTPWHGMVALGSLNGAGDTRFTMRVSVAAAWFLNLPLSYGLTLVAGWGAVGAWLGLTVEIVGLAVIALWRVRGDQWLENVPEATAPGPVASAALGLFRYFSQGISTSGIA